MDEIVTLFQYPLMDHMENRDIKNKLDICYPQKPTIDLTSTSNSETGDSIYSDKPSPSDEAQIYTYLPSPISAVPLVATKAQFFQLLKYLLVYHNFLYQGNHRLFLQKL